MDRVLRNDGNELRWNVRKVFSLLSTQRKLTYEQRLRLKEDGRPCPKVTIKHRSSDSAYELFKWICGDEEKNTFYCWPCLVIGDLSTMKNVSFVQETGFSSSGSNLWNVGKRHEGSKKHIANHTAYKLFGNVDVACALDEARQRAVIRHNHDASRYSRMMEHHVDVTAFLAAQGLAFRGHDEARDSPNRGNFLQLLEMLGNYSNDLRHFLDNDKITYTSHGPQNELIECIYEEVKQEIQTRIDTSKFISVMMDDTSDASNVEQSAVSVRLVHDGEIEEHLLGLIDASADQSAGSLTDIMLSTLEGYKVVPDNGGEKVVGQSYDGAPTMSGNLNGVQKQVQEHFPAAYYNHCVAHKMSLCASQSAMKTPEIAKFFSTLDKIISFFRSSPKRTKSLGHNVPKPGDTRWLSRDTATSAVDTFYEEIGTVLFEITNEKTEKAEVQAMARGLGMQMQEVAFVYFLKLYRIIFEYCTPIITVMQKPTLDPVQLRSMLDDFQRVLENFNYKRVWQDTLLADPDFPAVRARAGWRAMEQGIDGTKDKWKISLETVARQVTKAFSDQMLWRFENLEKFRWMELIHPTKFEQRKKATSAQQRALLNDARNLYPFAVPDIIATENNLDVLYNNKEIAMLLKKLVSERDAVVAKKREKRRKLAKEIENPQEEVPVGEEAAAVEERDEFEVEVENIDFDLVKEGSTSVQDLLQVIKQAELEEALPQALVLLELAATIPLTSVHCERVFSRMKRVVSASRSRMKQARKEMLVMLQVEHKLLRSIAAKPLFKLNVVSRFKSYNERRFERFSKK
eukprot:gene2228-2538_t